MKRLFFLLTILLLLSIRIEAQDYKYAWIINPQIGKEGADTTLSKIVEDINKNTDLDYVIVSGNLTMHGLNKEIDLAKKLLDKLKINYYTIPGESDLRWSENAGLKYFSTFHNGHFLFNHKKTQQLGVNSSIVWRGGGGHFSPEEINWVSDTLNTLKNSKEIFIYSYFPFDLKLDNWFKLTNYLGSYNFIGLFNSDGKEKTITIAKGFNSITGVKSNNSTDYSYNIIENKTDSLLFYQVEGGSPEIWGSIKKSKPGIVKVTHNDFFDYNNKEKSTSTLVEDSLLWQIDLKETSLSDILTNGDEIYSVSRNGKVYCFNSDGNKKWEYNSNENIVTKPVIEKNNLVFGTLQGDLISLDSKTGEVVQIIGIGEPITSQLIKTKVEYNGNETTGVVAGTANGNLFCYDIFTFELIWENNSAQGLIRTKPLDIDHRLFYGSQDGFLYSVDDRTGTLYWKWKDKNDFFTSPAVCPPVSEGKYIYISTPDKFVSKIDMLLGVSSWRKNDYSSWESIGITSDRKYLIVKSISKIVFLVNISNGRVHKEIKMDFGFDLNPNVPLDWKGNILFGTDAGTVYIIGKKYNWQPLFFMGNAGLNSIQHLSENKFVASNIDGKIVCFELK